MSLATRLSQSSDLASALDRAQTIGRHAIDALHAELTLAPKPGLVSPVDNGSHDDMSMTLFQRSAASLRDYFVDIAMAGMSDSAFADLQRLGLQAEGRMLMATNGVNTHRGAIFSVGLLCAAAGLAAARGIAPKPDNLCGLVRTRWGREIAAAAPAISRSNGSLALARYGGLGARAQAALGYPVLVEVAFPARSAVLAMGVATWSADIQALFAIMAVLHDTNLLHRGGAEGLAFAQREASRFLDEGGVVREHWEAEAWSLHRAFVARRLSPGGAADLLACTLLLTQLTGLP